MTGRLQDKVALITGGAAGIGRATSLLFAREGAAIAVMDRDAAGARSCADEIVSTGGRAISVVADVTRKDQIEAAVSTLIDRFEGLDILINNAGVPGPGSVESVSEGDWQRVIDINLTGVFLVSRAALPAMRERGGGSVVNVSSAAGLVGWYDQAAYDASKGGVVNLTRSMALDLALHGVRVNCLVPAHVATALTDVMPPEVKARLMDAIPLGRFSQPEEVAYAALFLACDESSYVTGSMLVVDGGYLAR